MRNYLHTAYLALRAKLLVKYLMTVYKFPLYPPSDSVFVYDEV
jgi:hypothetical protein